MFSRSQSYATAIFDLWEKAPEHERGKIIGRFIDVLRFDRMLPLLPHIIKTIEQLSLDKEKAEAVTAEFVRQPTDRQHESLKKLQVTQFQKTPTLVGGFRIIGRNKIIDASVRGGLKQVQLALTRE